MSKWVTGGRIWHAARWAPIVACLGLCACSSAGEPGLLVLADPGKYQYHNCEQIAAAHKSGLGRQKDLKGLIDKAEQGAGGAFIGVIAYRSDYVAVSQDLSVIEATARDKNCPLAPASAPPPTRRSDTAIH